MDTTVITPAGYIVAPFGGPIYGFGTTEAEARAMARKWIEDDPEIKPYVEGQTGFKEMFIAPATQAILDLVKEVGGDVGYWIVNGVVCATEEATLED